MRSVAAIALGAAICTLAFSSSGAWADTAAKDASNGDCATLQSKALGALRDTSGIDTARTMAASADVIAREMILHADKIAMAAGKFELSCGHDVAMRSKAKTAMENAQAEFEKLNKGP
jgi:uncharacterized lipoprotein NlpE involved in copper resistance